MLTITSSMKPIYSVLIIKVIERKRRFLWACFDPLIKLLDCLLKTQLPFGFLPCFEIARSDERFPSDLHHRDPIFFNDFAEVAECVPCFKSRRWDVEEVALFLAR